MASRLTKVLPWLEKLAGLECERCTDAIGTLRAWKLEHVERELLSIPDLDTLAAVTLLVESVAALTDQGVQRTKLIKKLRDARTTSQFWPVWAEIRAAAILIGRDDIHARIELEPGATQGRHADFHLTQADGESIDIEFKAVGLSAAEVAWHRAAAEHFNRLLPPRGLATFHGLRDKPIWVRTEKRRRAFQESGLLAEEVRTEFPPQYPGWSEVRGVSIVAREEEDSYLKRTAARLSDALGQMSSSRENWLGLWWGNGAPLSSTKRVLAIASAPSSVAGVASIGQGIAVPWPEINVFIANVPGDADNGQQIDSAVDDHLAQLVLDRFDSSSGIRPTFLRAPGRESTILLRRDGSRRLFPFNLLFDADPRALAGPTRPPSPVQDVRLGE